MSVVSFETIYKDRIALLKEGGETTLIQSVYAWMENAVVETDSFGDWAFFVKEDEAEWMSMNEPTLPVYKAWLMTQPETFYPDEGLVLSERELPRRPRFGVSKAGRESLNRLGRISPEVMDEMRHLMVWEKWEMGDVDGLVALLTVDQTQFAVIRELGTTRQDIFDLLQSQWRLIPWGIVLTLIVGWWISTRALHPVNQVVDAMKTMGLLNLRERMNLSDATVEFEELINVYNSMLDRLESSFYQATRFSADAAHELKTPLTILQGELELAISEAEMGSEWQQRMTLMLDEVVRLRILTERLLLLARADAANLDTEGAPFDLGLAIEEWVDTFRDTLNGITIKAEVEPLLVEGSETLLRQAVMNLLTNASKYNSEDGRIEISLRKERDAALIEVFNTGKAISPDAQKAIFQRFYRGDQSRNRRVDGLGLGLSIVHAIVSAHGGSVELVSSDEEGTHFRIMLPIFNP